MRPSQFRHKVFLSSSYEAFLNSRRDELAAALRLRGSGQAQPSAKPPLVNEDDREALNPTPEVFLKPDPRSPR